MQNQLKTSENTNTSAQIANDIETIEKQLETMLKINEKSIKFSEAVHGALAHSTYKLGDLKNKTPRTSCIEGERNHLIALHHPTKLKITPRN